MLILLLGVCLNNRDCEESVDYMQSDSKVMYGSGDLPVRGHWPFEGCKGFYILKYKLMCVICRKMYNHTSLK